MNILQKKIFDLFPAAFGLDLSDLSMKAVWLNRTGQHDSIVSFGSVPLPVGSVIDGEIMNTEAVESAHSPPPKIRSKKNKNSPSSMLIAGNQGVPAHHFSSRDGRR